MSNENENETAETVGPGLPQMTYGRACYEAYVASGIPDGGRAAVSYDELPEAQRKAWADIAHAPIAVFHADSLVAGPTSEPDAS